MDSNWVSNSSSRMMEVDDAASKNACTSSNWTREEDKAFENALATYYNDADMWEKIVFAVPGKTIDDLKLHYEALCKDVEDIEFGKVPVPDFQVKAVLSKRRKSQSKCNEGLLGLKRSTDNFCTACRGLVGAIGRAYQDTACEPNPIAK